MNVALSDLVTCPRCGPGYGLILLPDEVRNRRVVSGVLGCANCRERYPIAAGVADLRVPGGAEGETSGAEAEEVTERTGAEAAEGEPARPGEEEAVRVAALLGLAGATGTVLVVGAAARSAAYLAEVVEDVEVVAAGAAGTPATPGTPAGFGPVTVLRLDRAIPFRSGSLRGVVLGAGWSRLLGEAVRVLGPGARVVVDGAPGDACARLGAAGLRVVAEREGTVVAEREGTVVAEW